MAKKDTITMVNNLDRTYDGVWKWGYIEVAKTRIAEYETYGFSVAEKAEEEPETESKK